MPDEFVVCAGLVYFRATDGIHGFELWVTDGTASGTQLVADLEPGAPGSEPRHLTCCGSRVFFQAFAEATGFEPHVSDGTAAGTSLLADLNPGVASSFVSFPRPACGPNNDWFFVADDGANGRELWTSDGTGAGTVRLSDLRAGVGNGIPVSSQLTACGGELFFVGDSPGTGSELFKTDGTAAGTVLVRDIEPGSSGSSIAELTCCGGELFFRARPRSTGAELFKSDGTGAGTVLVKDIRPGTAESFPRQLVCCDGTLFFQARDGSLGVELFKSDGSTAGTLLVKDLIPGSSSGLPQAMVCCDGLLYFSANSPNGGSEPYVSDGTTSGTLLLADLAPGPGSSFPRNFSCCGSKVLFTARGPDGNEMYQVDGGVGNQAALALDIRPGDATLSSSPREITAFGSGSNVAFTVNIDGMGRELATVIDGTLQVHDLRPGPSSSSPDELTSFGEFLTFTASEPTTGRELWAVGATITAPQQVADLRPGSSSSSPEDLLNFEDQTLVFAANDGVNGTELAQIDISDIGAPTFTISINDINSGPNGSDPADFRVLTGDTGESSFVFTVTTQGAGDEIAFGNDTGTITVIDINPGPNGSSPDFPDSPVQGDFEEGFAFTVVLDSEPSIVEASASSGGGAGITVEPVDDLSSVIGLPDVVFRLSNDADKYLVEIDDRSPTGIGSELFKIDVGADSVQLLEDLNPGPAGSNPRDFVDLGDLVVFAATAGGKGTELVTYDRFTDALTVLDVFAGPIGSNPRGLLRVGDRVWFRATGANSTDVDVYSTDGVSVVKEVDLCPGDVAPDSSMSVSSAGLFFAGHDESVGVEVWLLPNPGARVELVGRSCDGRARTTASTPKIGQALALRAFGGPANHIGVLGLDVRRGAPTQFTGCDLWIDLPTAVQLSVSSQPRIDIELEVPNDVSLVGGQFVAQTVWWPTSTIVPVVSSNAVVLTVGR